MKTKARPEPGAFGEAWELLFNPPVAHRGLWSPGGAPENSLAAFQAAMSHRRVEQQLPGFAEGADVGSGFGFHQETSTTASTSTEKLRGRR